MKAAAAATLRRLNGARAAKPGEPCLLLLGSPDACHAVRQSLSIGAGAAGRISQYAEAVADDGCRLRGDVLPGGGVLVEVPEALQNTGQVTELATFLRGLRDVHGVIMACSEEPPKDAHGGHAGASADTLRLLSEFYGSELCVLIAVAAPKEIALEVAAPYVQKTVVRIEGAGLSRPIVAPEIVAVGYGDATLGAHLAERLRRSVAVKCEPLRSSSPLLAQYRSIRERLGGRRASPPGNREARQPGGAPQQPASPSYQPPSPQEQARGHQSVDVERPSHDIVGLRMSRKTRWTVMVFGKTGAGKSHLANLLCGYHAFESGDSVASVTNTQSVRKAASKDDSVLVLDTIGFGDTCLPPESVVRSLRDTALEAPGGIDAMLFVLKKERVTSAEQETLAYVTEDLFGPECLPNLYMVVTRAGRLAKEADLREPWLKEQAAASAPFRGMLQKLGSHPVERIAFIENSDPLEAEDEEDRALAERRRQRALVDIQALLERHAAPAYQHGIMHRAGEVQALRLEEMRRELRQRVESEVREDLEEKLAGMLEEERQKVKAEAETLKEREAEMQRRFEEEWARMRSEFEDRARELSRADLEPLAQEIVDNTEKKAKGRRCTIQ
mmetsp:Transcript_37126/g.106943  ORF Transcript_37126/g.106943 Transcript_37126/m.106943 type:complete len:614 (+) Transcript_37126:119-1960(+)